MLTQEQIDIIRSRDCTFSGELDELLDMAEALLAVEQYVKTPTIPCCDDPTYDDGKETERLAVLDIISEYLERGNK